MSALRPWLPAMAGMTCLGLSIGLVSMFGFFVPYLSLEFGVGVAVINMAPVVFLLAPGLLSPLVGPLVDRWSIRALILLGSAVAMLSLFLLSRATSLVAVTCAFVLFALGLICYGPVVVNALMVKLYPGREARALAIASLGISVSSITLPVFVGAVLQVLDWRTSLALLSLAMLAVIWLWALLALPAGVVAAPVVEREGVGSEITRRVEFWLVGGLVAMALGVTLVLAICYPPLLVNRGFSAVQAGLFLSVGGAAGFCGKVLIAGFADAARHHTHWVVACLLLVMLTGLLLLATAQNTALLITCVALLGFSGGSFLPLHPYLNSRYFSADIIGRVNGAQSPFFLPLGLTAPPLAGYIFDQTGSYQLVVQSLALLPLIGLVLLVSLPRPAR